MVICSAHERKAAGHLKVGCISLLTSHFFKHVSKIIDFFFFCPLFLCFINFCRLTPVFFIWLAVSPSCRSAEFDRSRVLESPLNSAIQHARRASLLQRFMGIRIRLLIFIQTPLIRAHLPPLFRASFTCFFFLTHRLISAHFPLSLTAYWIV